MATSPVQPEDQLVGRNPYNTPCNCGTSMVLLQPPFIHCPSCHATYRQRKLDPPTRCARCDFNLHLWRVRNNFKISTPPFK